MLDGLEEATTPAWLKMTPRIAGTPRMACTPPPPMSMRPLGDLTAAAANKSPAEATPDWLKKAGRVVQKEASASGSASPLASTSSVGQVIAIVAKNKGLKLGCVKVQDNNLASLRKHLARELPQLHRLFPKGFVFALHEGDVPVMRTQETTWLVDDVATAADGGRLTVVIMDAPAHAAAGGGPSELYERLRLATSHALLQTAAAKTQLAQAWQKRFAGSTPVTRLLACGPTLLNRGGVRLRSHDSIPLPPMATPLAIMRQTSSTRTPVPVRNFA